MPGSKPGSSSQSATSVALLLKRWRLHAQSRRRRSHEQRKSCGTNSLGRVTTERAAHTRSSSLPCMEHHFRALVFHWRLPRSPANCYRLRARDTNRGNRKVQLFWEEKNASFNCVGGGCMRWASNYHGSLFSGAAES